MGYSIVVIDGDSLNKLDVVLKEHNPINVREVARGYIQEYGEITRTVADSDCITLVTYAGGKVLGFSI